MALSDNTAKISSLHDAIDALPESGGGGSLDPLTNPAAAGDIISGKESYSDQGVKLTGSYVPLDTSDATASASEILDGETAYVNGVKVTGTYEPIVLPSLTSPASASDILDGKEVILPDANDQPVKVTGTLSVFTSGNFSDLCEWLTKGWDHTEFTVPSTTSNVITINHTLGKMPTSALVYPKTDFLNAYIGMAFETFQDNVNNRWGYLALTSGYGLYKMFASRMQSSACVSSATISNITLVGQKLAGTYILAVR